jgi:hypothetical protein
MSDIDSKKDSNSNKDNSQKIGDYGIKLGSSIIKFCILILLGCLILYASKACGSGILDIIIPTYYIKGLTDTMLFKPDECPTTETYETEKNATTNDEQILNTQYINCIKNDKNQSLYQKLNFSYNSENKDAWSSLHEELKVIREEVQKKPVGNKDPTKSNIPFYQLFISGVISNVTIFNLKFLNSFFKFLNNNFSDSATIIFGPFISMIILLIIVIMSIFVTAYYIVYNVQWLVLNTAPPKYIDGIMNVPTHNSKIFINGAPIFYIPYKNLLIFPWMLWIGWCILIGYGIAVTIFPLSMGITAYTLLKWVFFILFLPSTYEHTNDDNTKDESYDNTKDNQCDPFTMFVDSFKYKRPLISWIMTLIVISTSFDVFDTAGGSIAIIVFLLVYFNIIKIGLFDKYVPTPEEAKTFVEMTKGIDVVAKCVAKYEEVEPKGVEANKAKANEPDAEPDAEPVTDVDSTTDAAIDDINKTIDAAKKELTQTTDAATNVIDTAADAATDAATKAAANATSGEQGVEMVNLQSPNKDAIESNPNDVLSGLNKGDIDKNVEMVNLNKK